MPYDENSPQAKWGKAAETWVDLYRQELGWWRVPVSNLGAAALCSGPDGKLIALDRLYFAGGNARWCDIKFKTAPVHYRIKDVMRHGIDLPNWHHYLAVQQKSGIPGDLAIVVRRRHGDPQLPDDPHLLWAPLDHLATCGETGPVDSAFRDGGIFWNLADLPELGSIVLAGADDLPPLDRNLHPWERRDRFGKLRLPPLRPLQMELFK